MQFIGLVGLRPAAVCRLDLRCPDPRRSHRHPVITPLPRNRQTVVRAAGDSSGDAEKETETYVPPDDEPTLTGKIFGSYLQLGVWIVVLAFAGYKGIQQAQTDPASVGLLLAPPAGALFLIVTFLFTRFLGKKDEDAP